MRRRRPVLWVLLGAAVALQVASLPRGAPDAATEPPSVTTALLGPVAGLFASVLWVRVDAAFAAGEPARAFALAERALDLDPGATDGWSTLVWYQAVQLAAPAREPDADRRRRWLENGLAVARRGEGSAREPSALARLAGDILFVHADAEPPTPWPGGRAGLLAAAAEAYTRALRLGDDGAGPSLDGVRRRLADAQPAGE